jgi:two-component system, chemotaxis family, protein-glutamate methylesterase/glutaminase
MLAIQQAGGLTIAQEEKSCIVFGMPKEAIQLNAAKEILRPEEIGFYLNQLFKPKSEDSG